MAESDNMLSVLESLTNHDPDEVAMALAGDFRRRRIEKNLTRKRVAELAGVAESNVARFEQKGLISLHNLIALAMALQYTAEVKGIFSQPKYSTMEELLQIRRNANKKKAHEP